MISLRSAAPGADKHGFQGPGVQEAGGLFLLGKSTLEIHDRLESEEGRSSARMKATCAGVLVQVMLLAVVFSMDSVITAIGMARRLAVMVAAVVIAVVFMMAAAGGVSRFIEKHPAVKMLALSFLLLVGVALIADGLNMHIPAGTYISPCRFPCSRYAAARQSRRSCRRPYVGGSGGA